MMRAVVTSGTGTALATLPAPPASAKTGTAEYGNANPPATHAWMIGFRGQLAFAVYVETGVSGGRTAGPIAAAFLRAVG
jgi:cell division protein FtsI/penicillin-binding protein 2